MVFICASVLLLLIPFILPVTAVNALLRLYRMPGDLTASSFSATDCSSDKFITRITCNCRFENNTACRVTRIDLSSNQLRGMIPESFVKLSRLLILYLFKNNLQGPVPHFLAKMKSLRILSLSDNGFNESIPVEFGNLTSLEYLDMANNLLSGNIPDELGNISSLKGLYLQDNQLLGQLPEKLGELSNLQYVYLMNNLLTGPIPPSFQNLQNLQDLTLTGNNFDGPLPAAITGLTRLNYLFINDLVGGGQGFSFPEVKSSANLQILTLRNCSLTGPIPDFIWKLQGLNYLDLSFNNLTGGIPLDVNLRFLKYIFLRSNKLNQTFPGWLTNSNLSNVDVSENFFTNVTISTANISSNMNLFSCCTNTSNKDMKWLEANYYCENNSLTRWDETKDSNIKRRRVFDVDVQGGQYYLKDFNIEEEAGGVDKDITKEFNIIVSGRRLEIHLYFSGKGSTIAPTKYYGPLISAISLSPVLKKHRKLPLPSATIGGIAGCATLFVILELAILWKLGWLGGKISKGEAIELYPGGIFYFHQIKEATKNFNPDNKIGEGGFGTVYKGVLPNGTQVAVKQLSAKSKQGAREFMNEIATTYALQHPNLVKLMGCCVEQNELLLVYEYMENNSLNHALFGPAEVKSRLTWQTRVRICCDVAKGLAFLHEESKLKIIHRDIKPTNVLLDKDLNAKISDFGYAQLNEEEHAGVITKIAGTTGYMAPENYLEGLLTPKVDVYSFGIVTLEIVSGKKIRTLGPNNQTIYLLDTAYAYQKEKNLIGLLDRDLGSDYTYSEALKILNLAMQCVSHAPTQRPSMSEVAEVLEGILKVEESKRKRKTVSTSSTLSVDDPTILNPVAVSSQSTQSGSTSQDGGPSVTTISPTSSKEIEDWSTSAD